MLARLLVALFAATACLVVPAAEARAERKVFLNGIDLKDVEVSDKAFDQCKVAFDVDGNVHITVPGFEIRKRKAEGATDGNGAAEPAKLTQRYFVVNRGAGAGKVQFQVVVYVNDQRVKTIRPGDEDGVTEITRHLRAGANDVKVVAVKDLGKAGKRRSFSPEDRLEIVLGEGSADKGVVTIRKTLLQYERNASETGKFTDAIEFRTR